jgi:glycosyltransferase involved in cell wall biosynthesis
VYSDDTDSLAWGILHTLQHPEWAARRVENAYRVVREEYNWERIAQRTYEIYGQVTSEAALVDW